MAWRVELLDYLETIYEDLGFEFFGTWNLQNNEEEADILATSNGLLLNIEFNNQSIVNNGSQHFISIEDNAEFEIFVYIKNKNFNIEKAREIFGFCDELQKRMLQNDSGAGDITFLGESPVLPHNELMIRSQRYSLRTVQEIERIQKLTPVEEGDITKINTNICIN